MCEIIQKKTDEAAQIKYKKINDIDNMDFNLKQNLLKGLTQIIMTVND